jgi:hypothetical protein
MCVPINRAGGWTGIALSQNRADTRTSLRFEHASGDRQFTFGMIIFREALDGCDLRYRAPMPVRPSPARNRDGDEIIDSRKAVHGRVHGKRIVLVTVRL